MDCVAPGVSVSGHVRPLRAVYVTHIERLLEAVFVAFLTYIHTYTFFMLGICREAVKLISSRK